MRVHRNLRLVLGIAAIAGSAAAQAGMQQDVSNLEHRWAVISYQTPKDQREAAFDKLITTAQQVTAAYPGHAEPLIWQAIILSSDAKVEGGLGALSKVKHARKLLFAAKKIDPTAMDGSIYCSLGSLYAKVPGWPLGYGNKKKAAQYFHKALAVDPNNIDSNYFYADLLADEGDYAAAARHLQKALAAPPRPARADADMGRRQEAQRLLDKLKKNHGEQLVGLTNAHS